MLALTAKEGDRIGVGEMLIKVISLGSGKVCLGFDGPREIPVIRENAKRREPKERGKNIESK